ncbi:hypothetical protein SLEP1_g45540 [Rubroshorea leprosula]|uniref:PB1-like domain-containing protein n=1 Tax=Rubroshorea leprosula TaxID=152421 RepID=A0AAV5LK44_9ROSI|nr:hypothetical protein SLEP1_g45540 [Rubroshorea leprosula]
MTVMGTLRIHHGGTFCMSHNGDLRYTGGEVHDEDIEYHRIILSYLEERVKDLGYMHFKDIYYKDPYVENFGEALKVINSMQELIHMRYLLNERGIIDVYVEHVCDEPNILDLLEGGTVPHEVVDEGTMHFSGSDEDIGEGCVTQNSQPTPTCNGAPETTEGDVDEIDAVHGGDVGQQQDPKHNDHDDDDFLDNVHSDADDEEGERVPVGIDSHGDLGFDSSFENSEDEFEVSSDDSSDYTVMDEDELEEEEGDVRTTRSGDLWFYTSWADVWFEIIISELVRLSHLELGVHVSRDNCKLAKDKIMKEVKETHMNEFAQLRRYTEELLRLSLESIVKIVTEPPTTPERKPAFKGIYVCLEGCRKGFLLGCRLVIGLDDYFLKGIFKGTLLAIVTRDENNQMFPIAWAVVDS